jgi:hypothetical protein
MPLTILKLSALVFPVAVAVAVASLASTANAYIPTSRTIASRLARNNGKGVYAIEQEVQFRTGSETATLRERWIVENGETMRLWVSSVSGQPARFDAVYRSGKRTAPDFSGNVRSTSIPSEFIERYPHARSSIDFLDSLVRAQILPQSFLRERPHFTMANQNATTKAEVAGEPLVRLGRTAGIVNYIFGEPTPVDTSKNLPGVWIEQDEFSLRRLRFPSQAEVTADQYALQAGTIRFPNQRVVTWNDHTAIIRTISVKSVDAKTASAVLNPASITSMEAKAAKLPDQAQVKEFYSRFR